MKMSESILRTIIRAIDKTNENYVMCDPTVPMWTSHFARNLEDALDKKVAR